MTLTMKKSYIKQLLTQPQAKFTPKLPIIPEEGSDKIFQQIFIVVIDLFYTACDSSGQFRTVTGM